MAVSCTAQVKVTINRQFPIQGPSGQSNLSAPHIDSTNECSVKVRVDSFVPKATINVYWKHPGLTLIGGPYNSFYGFAAVPLTRTLQTGDQVVATQTVNGVTSAYSSVMTVGAMPSSLQDPDVLPTIYACGVIAPVDRLVSGVTVDVQDQTTLTTIGTDTTPNPWSSGGWDPPTTTPLLAPPTTSPAHKIRAKQTACTGVHSNYGPTLLVADEPHPVLAPTLEPPIVGNDAVTLDGLYVGAQIEVKDGSTPDGSGDAIGTSNWQGLNAPITASSNIRATQKLCQASGPSKPVTPTKTIPPPTLDFPICSNQSAASVENSTINATLVLLANGTPIGYGGSGPGTVPLDLATPAAFVNGQNIQVAEYLGSDVVLSNSVVVGCGKAQVVDMIPIAFSAETNQDSEPFLAVDAADANRMVGTAFTLAQKGSKQAPVFVTQDGGNIWTLNFVVPINNPGVSTLDITTSYAGAGTALYEGRLSNCLTSSCSTGFATEFEEQETSDASVTTTFAEQASRFHVDQPFTRATTVGGNDRVYMGNNDFNNQPDTATIDVSPNGGSSYNSVRIDPRSTSGQDGPSIRPSFAKDGTVYAGYFRWTANSCPGCNVGAITSDVVVVRDDSGGVGSSPFQALTDSSDGNAGQRVVQGVSIPWSNQPTLGQERTGSTLSVAVDPNHSSTVYIAWADNVTAGSIYTIHVRKSADKGQTWSTTDVYTAKNSLCVALAIANNGVVGLLYQQLTGQSTPINGLGGSWVTHLVQTNNSFGTTQDTILARPPANTPGVTFVPYLGDYLYLLALGNEFRGIFSANNTPNLNSFPQGVAFQRVANFTTQTLETSSGAPVAISIDPFYFSFPVLGTKGGSQ